MCHTVGSKVLPTIETKFEWGAPFPEPYTELISTMSCLSADGVRSRVCLVFALLSLLAFIILCVHVCTVCTDVLAARGVHNDPCRIHSRLSASCFLLASLCSGHSGPCTARMTCSCAVVMRLRNIQGVSFVLDTHGHVLLACTLVLAVLCDVMYEASTTRCSEFIHLQSCSCSCTHTHTHTHSCAVAV